MPRIIFAALIILFFLPAPAWACKCYPPNDELGEETFSEADIVIRAKIVNPSKGFTQSGPLLSVKTLEVIKGENVPDAMNVNYNNVPAACGNHFEPDEEVIIGIYDTRDLSVNAIARGYGFRLMSSCQQYYIRHHLKMMQNNKEPQPLIQKNETE